MAGLRDGPYDIIQILSHPNPVAHCPDHNDPIIFVSFPETRHPENLEARIICFVSRVYTCEKLLNTTKHIDGVYHLLSHCPSF